VDAERVVSDVVLSNKIVNGFRYLGSDSELRKEYPIGLDKRETAPG
jgi:hypothetical protein